MFVDVSLVAKPTANVVDTSTGADLAIDSPVGLPTAVSVSIPSNSFQDENAETVSGDVNIYLTFADPRQPDGLDSAPGEFTFVDDEGETRMLQTFGVVTLVAEDSNGNEVFMSGEMTMTFDAAALGMQPEDSVALWTLDANGGGWVESGEFTSSDRRRRRRDTGSDVEGKTEIPPYVPYVNFDTPVYLSRLCTVAVYVYYDKDFSIPMSGQKLSAYILQNGFFLSRTTASTDRNGRACVVVLCGQRAIIRIESAGVYQVHPTHFLPDGFAFSNRATGFEFTAPSSSISISSSSTDPRGPVYRKPTWSDSGECYDSNATAYHFMLAWEPLLPSVYGSLNAVELRPGFPNSWYPNPPAQREVCAIRIDIAVRINCYACYFDNQQTLFIGKLLIGNRQKIVSRGLVNLYENPLSVTVMPICNILSWYV